MSKDAYGFIHDANARNDVRLLKIRARFGLAGVGWYWCVVEMLREATGYKLSRHDSEGLAMSLNLDTPKFVELLDAATEFCLFEQDGHLFYSPSLLRRMETFDNKRAQLRQNALQRYCKSSANAEQNLNINLIQDPEDPDPEESEKILVQKRPSVLEAFKNPDARKNPRAPHPKFPLLWFSELELAAITSRFKKSALRDEYHEQAFATVEQWFTDTTAGRKEYKRSSNHMRRVTNWGLKAALQLQREADYARKAESRLR